MKYAAVIFDLCGTLGLHFLLRDILSLMSEIATVLGVPSADFVRLCIETLDVREADDFANIGHIFRNLSLDHFDGNMLLPVSQMRRIHVVHSFPLGLALCQRWIE